MQPRSFLLPFLLSLSVCLCSLGCPTAEPVESGGSGGGGGGGGGSPKVFDVTFEPDVTVTARNTDACGPVDPDWFRSSIGAAVNMGSTRPLAGFDRLLMGANEVVDIPVQKLIRVDEGDEVCVFSQNTAYQRVNSEAPLSEDMACVDIAATTTRLDFHLRMENGCALEVDVEATALEVSEGVIFQPVDAVASSSFNANTLPTNLIDGSELSGTGPLKEQTHGNGANAEGMWQVASAAGNPPSVAVQWVRFDLGQNRDLAGAYVWNLNQRDLTGRGVRDFQIEVTSDMDATTATWTSLGLFRVDEACNCAGETSQFVPFQSLDVRHVRLRMRTTWSGRMAGGEPREYVGLSEVAFVEQP